MIDVEMEELLLEAQRWDRSLFKAPLPKLDAALGAPEPETKPPAELSVGARRAWFDLMAVRLGKEHWEILASRGLIPLEWVEEEYRFFLGQSAVYRPERGETSTTYARAKFPHPASPEVAIAIAANAAGIAASEELLREYFRRVRSWDATPIEAGVLWDFAALPHGPSWWMIPDELVSTLLTAPQREAVSTTRWALGRALRSFSLRSESRREWVTFAIYLSFLSKRWNEAVAGEESVRSGSSFVYGRRFREFANPFEPLLELFSLGYAYAGRDLVFSLPTLCGTLP